MAGPALVSSVGGYNNGTCQLYNSEEMSPSPLQRASRGVIKPPGQRTVLFLASFSKMQDLFGPGNDTQSKITRVQQ